MEGDIAGILGLLQISASAGVQSSELCPLASWRATVEKTRSLRWYRPQIERAGLVLPPHRVRRSRARRRRFSRRSARCKRSWGWTSSPRISRSTSLLAHALAPTAVGFDRICQQRPRAAPRPAAQPISPASTSACRHPTPPACLVILIRNLQRSWQGLVL